jgi:hypothetical protein
MSPNPDLDTNPLAGPKLAAAMIANRRWAQRLGWSSAGEALAVLLDIPWAGPGDAGLAQAAALWQRRNALSVDGIIGNDTWGALKKVLAPADSLTGIVPPGAPAVPNGFDEVIAAFGDPRPLLGADGRMPPENDELWQRRILAKGTLPFPIPLDDPPGPQKTTFWAHRRLTPVFEAVFQEIDRLGLRGAIRTWGGIYNFRSIRGRTNLSLHAFGAAIDLNAASNQLGTAGDMNPRVVEVFTHFGFRWGGDFRGRPDPMHFQYATGV